MGEKENYFGETNTEDMGQLDFVTDPVVSELFLKPGMEYQ